MLDAHRTKSQQVYNQFQADRTKVINDRNLSDTGKREQLAKLKTNYDRSVGVIRDEALQELDSQRQRATKAAQAARAKAVEGKRATLGDQVYADLLRRQVEAMPSAQLKAWYEESAPGFERELVAAYGAIVVESRINAGSAEREDHQAYQAFAQREPDDLRVAREQLRDVDNAERRLDELDPATYAVAIGDKFGVNAAYVNLSAPV